MYLDVKLEDFIEANTVLNDVRWRVGHCKWTSRWHTERYGQDSYKATEISNGYTRLDLMIDGDTHSRYFELITLLVGDTLTLTVRIH